ncbi:sulfur carrier protein ThiS [Flectobacillus major]|jgi:sulfur carrier protein|uniref:sulfur carrier protein ThiS n=1 Tax=Flectobacillus major TaxID=103 RepID=UPI0003FC9741|nr:sulfur carrier protein ThiS [Flectobacillus major]
MTLFVNNQALDFPEEVTVAMLLNEQQLTHLKGLAIAVNDWVLPKTAWANYRFSHNDHITIIRASQGG